MDQGVCISRQGSHVLHVAQLELILGLPFFILYSEIVDSYEVDELPIKTYSKWLMCGKDGTSESVRVDRNERLCRTFLLRSRARPPRSAANFTPDAPQSEVEAED